MILIGNVRLKNMRKIRQPKHGPEYFIQQDIIAFLEARGWHVERIIGNAFQRGLPDLEAYHRKWGVRKIEAKRPDKYTFTNAQKRKFPILEAYGVGIWIMNAATQEEYDKLFAPPNWRDYVKKNWKIPTMQEVEAMIDELGEFND